VASDDCWLDQTVIPECFSLPPPAQSPTYRLDGARSAAIAAYDQPDGQFELFAVDRSSDNALARSITCLPSHECWFGWFCFDAVPDPLRIAATTMSNDAAEVFVTNACGRIYVRRYFDGSRGAEGWSPWVPFGRPPGSSFIVDISTARLRSATEHENHVFVVDDAGRIFTTSKGDDPYGPYGPWRSVGSGAGSVIASGLTDGRLELFTIDEHGQPHAKAQRTNALEAPFGGWTDFDPEGELELVDIDAPYGVGGTPLVVAVDSEGAIHAREKADDEYGEWQPFGPEPPTRFVSISGAGIATRSDKPLILVAVDIYGSVFIARRTNDSLGNPVWEPWKDPLF
jgi:hypothetical protein